MADPVIRSISVYEGSAGETSASINLPAGAADGDLLVLFWGLGDPASITWPSGFTQREADSQSTNAAGVATKVASSEPSSYSVSWDSSAKATGILVAFSVHDGFDVSGLTEQTSTSPISPGVTPSVAGAMTLSCLMARDANSGANTVTAPSGMTTQSNVRSGTPLGVVGQLNSLIHPSATATGAFTYGYSQARASTGITVAIKPTVAATQTITAGAPVASVSDVGTHALELRVNAGAPVASLAGVGAHGVSFSAQTLTAGAPVASLADVSSHAVELNVDPGAPVASLADVGANSVSFSAQGITAGAPVASLASVGSHSLSQGVDLSSWIPVDGHSAYEWSEGAAWTDVHVVNDLGISELDADIAPALKTHIDDFRNDRIRYIFPAGTFKIDSLLQINRDEKRLVGAGSSLTKIEITGGGFIRFQGYDGQTVAVTTAPSRGDNTVEVADASVISVGETITIRQDLDDTVTGTDDNTSPYSLGTITPESWGAQSWEQIVEVTAVDTINDIVTFTPKLALDYSLAKNPEVKEYINVFDGSIEGITIDVKEDTGLNALEFDRCRQCLVRDVHVITHAKMALRIAESFEIEVDRYAVDGARDTGTGGNGYGVAIELGSSRVYVHDSAFKDQRHCILIQSGASHNIIAYCYNATVSVEDLTDLSIHGHNAHHNLIEGCVVHGVVEINDFYPETQANLVFRNRVLGNSSFWDADSRPYSFWVRRNSEVALVGNRCETTSIARIFDGSEGSLETLNGSSDAPTGIPDSMYLSARPASWDVGYTWPPFAGNASNPIPAETLLSEKITAGAPVASLAGVGSHTLTQDVAIAPGAPVASLAGVADHALELNIEPDAPVDSVAAVGDHGLAMQITATSPALSLAALQDHALELNIEPGAPVASLASVGDHAFVTGIAAGAPVASLADVLDHTAELNIEPDAPVSSVSAVGDHSVSFAAQSVTAGAPVASAAAVGDHSVSLEILSGIANVSASGVGSHLVAQGLAVGSGAPNATLSGVGAHGLELRVTSASAPVTQAGVGNHQVQQSVTSASPVASLSSVIGAATLIPNIEPGAPNATLSAVGSHALALPGVLQTTSPVASLASVLVHSARLSVVVDAPNASISDVGTHSVSFPSQGLVSASPNTSSSSVGDHALSQEITALAPSPTLADVLVHVLGHTITSGAPEASQALVGSHVVSGNNTIVAGIPSASLASVGDHVLERTYLPDNLTVTVKPSRDLEVLVNRLVTLEVTVKPLSGMNTIFHTGEKVTFEGIFRNGDVNTSATDTVRIFVEVPGIDQVDIIEGIAETNPGSGIYRDSSYKPGVPGRYNWRMESKDGHGVDEGFFDVKRSRILPKNITSGPPPPTQESVLNHSVFI